MIRVLTLFFLAAFSASSHADVIDLDLTIDLNGVPMSSNQIDYTGASLPGAPVSVEIGDSIDLTVDFQGNQALIMHDDTGSLEWFNPWLGGVSNSGTFTIENIQFLTYLQMTV